MSQEIASLFVRIGSDLTGLTTGLTGAKNMVTSFGESMQSAGVAATLGLTVPLVGIGVAAGKAATDLDASMRNIQSISKQSDESLSTLKDTFVDMSVDINQTRDSANNLAEGFYQIQSSGFAGQDAMTVLQASTKAASAGLTTTETAARAVVQVLNAYSQGAQEAGHVSDVLFKAVDIGIFSFGDLANAIGDTLGSASAAKVPIEVVTAALSSMSKAGINVNEATTSLNQMLLSIINPSSGAADAAKTLGLSFDAAHLAAVGLPTVLNEIRDATGGDIDKLSELFPNVRALRGVLSLMRGDGQGFADDLQKISEASGSTAKAFEIQNKSWAAQLDNLKNIGTSILITLGEVIVPAVLDMAHSLLPLIDGLKAANPEWVKWTLILGGVAAAIGPVLVILGMLVAAVGTLLSPIGLIIGAVGFLVAAWVAGMGGIQNAAQKVVDWVTGIGLPAFYQFSSWFVNAAVPAIQNFLNGAWNQIQPALSRVFEWITGIGLPSLSAFAGWFANVVAPAIQSFLFGAWAALQPAMANAFNWLVGTGLPALTRLANWFTVVVGPAVSSFLSGAWSQLQPAIAAVANWVMNVGLPALYQLGEWFVTIAAPIIGNFMKSVWPLIVAGFTNVSNWITTVGLPALGQLREWFVSIGGPAILEFLGDAWKKLQDAWKAVSDWIDKTGLPALKSLSDWFDKTITPAVKTFLLDAWGKLQGALKDTSDWVNNTGIPAFNNLKSAIEKIASGDVKGGLNQLIPPDMIANLTTALTWIQALMDSITSQLGPEMKPVADAFGELAKTMAPLAKEILPLLTVSFQLLGIAVVGLLGLVTGLAKGLMEGFVMSAPFVKSAIEGLETMIDGLTKYLDGFVKSWTALVTGNTPAFWAAMGEMWDGAVKIVMGGLQLIGASMVAGFARMIGFVTGFVSGVTGFFQRLSDDLVGHSIVPDMMTAISNVIRNGLSPLASLFSSTFSGIVNGLQGQLNQMRNIGVNLVTGLISGFQSQLGQLYSTITSAGNQVISLIRNVFGVHSDSTEFIAIGQYLMSGLNTGVLNGLRNVLGTVSQAGSQIIQQAVSPLSLAGAPASTMSAAGAGGFGGGAGVNIEKVVLNNGMDLAEFKSFLKEALGG